MLCHAQFHIYTSISIVIYNIHRTVSFSYVCVVPPVFSFIFISLFSFGFSYDTRKVFALDNNTAKGGSEQKFKPKEEHKVFSRLATPTTFSTNFALISLNNLILMFDSRLFAHLFEALIFSHTLLFIFGVCYTQQKFKVNNLTCSKLNVVNVFIPWLRGYYDFKDGFVITYIFRC